MSSQKKFNISLPYGWEDQTVHIFRGPKEDDFQPSLMLVVDRHLQSNNIDEFAREKIDPIVTGMQGGEVLKDEDVTIPGGNPTYEFVYKMVISDEKFNFMKYVFVLKDGMGFTFSANLTKKTYKTIGSGLKDVIDAILPGTYYLEEGE